MMVTLAMAAVSCDNGNSDYGTAVLVGSLHNRVITTDEGVIVHVSEASNMDRGLFQVILTEKYSETEFEGRIQQVVEMKLRQMLSSDMIEGNTYADLIMINQVFFTEGYANLQVGYFTKKNSTSHTIDLVMETKADKDTMFFTLRHLAGGEVYDPANTVVNTGLEGVYEYYSFPMAKSLMLNPDGKLRPYSIRYDWYSSRNGMITAESTVQPSYVRPQKD